jgi:predicted dehydrogenase
MTDARPVIGLSGLGSIARQHASAFAASGARVIAFDPSAELRESATTSGLVESAVDAFEALLDRGPDAVVIASPDFAHLDQLALATARGIPTLVEKPLADDYDAALAAAVGIRASGAPVLVGYVLRHRRAVETARRLVADGAIGVPVSFQVLLGAYGTITAAQSRFATPEANRLYRDYSHEWDYVRWILGPVSEVLAVARTTPHVPHVESPNLVDGMLVLENDIAGSFHIDYVEPRGTRILTIVGTGGTLTADIGAGTVTVRRGGQAHDEVHSLAEAPAVPLARQAAHLLAVARGEESPRVTLDDGLAALAVTNALIRSAPTRSWVTVA